MRKAGTCTDVHFVCDSPNDEPLKAHRAYLAAYTDYFKVEFSGTFYEARDASSENPIIIRVPKHSRKCVEYIIGASLPPLSSTGSLLISSDLNRFCIHDKATTT